ncbi:hypothetical protein [Cellulomonas phragmiteti]|uniref:Uncharacterized protein n=1 Tax=Cellulomonas phragmiteti TaxID=478780 RepID=A0ABQ4DIA8_9CELL|nr:hypothetical protein [Cellulomonas phragmiteti]GIG39079.1 hypothetical protein Cph01nite_08410 [Cellulomonas phragmiteti]
MSARPGGPSRSVMRGRVERTDEGAGLVEYVGAIAVVVALVAGIMLWATPVGDQIVARLCDAFDADCGGGEIDIDREPERACTQATDTTSVQAGVSIAFIDLGGEGSMSVERMSDGTYRVTLNGEAAVKAVASAGEAHGGLEIMGYGGNVELSAEAAAGLFAGAGAEFTFSSMDEVQDFNGWVQRKVLQGAAVSAAGPGGPVVGLGFAAVGGLIDWITGYDYTPPAPSAVYAEGGVVANAGAGVGVGIGGGSAEVEMKNALGTKLDTATGDITIYTRVEISAEAAAQLGFSSSDPNWGQGGDVSGQVQMVVATTVGPDGRLNHVSLEGAASSEGAYALTDLGGYPISDGYGKGVTLSADFAVTDANRSRVTAALAGLGAVATTTGSPALGVAGGVPLIFDEARRSGDITAQFLDVSSQDLLAAALSLKAPAVGGLGFSLGASTSSSETTDAYYLTPTGWKDWTGCIA